MAPSFAPAPGSRWAHAPPGCESMSVPVPLRMRPLEGGDVLDETFRMYRRHFLLFAGISVILAIPSAAIFGVFFASFVAAFQQTSSPSALCFVAPRLTRPGAGLAVNLLILPFTLA